VARSGPPQEVRQAPPNWIRFKRLFEFLNLIQIRQSQKFGASGMSRPIIFFPTPIVSNPVERSQRHMRRNRHPAQCGQIW
jgi:hypothetical protein